MKTLKVLQSLKVYIWLSIKLIIVVLAMNVGTSMFLLYYTYLSDQLSIFKDL